jgi:hypothetical protein
MRKFLLGLAMLVVLASPSFAYVQSGHLLQDPQSSGKAPNSDVMARYRWRMGDGAPPAPNPGIGPLGDPGETVTRPIPEPGTMVLASLGLLALGVSRARRRGY